MVKTELKNKYGIFFKDLIESQLRNHLTVKKLGQIYNLKPFQILHVLHSMGITYRNNVNDTRILNPTISPEMHQVLLGTLLGDSFMGSSKAYQVSHSIYQMEYFYDILGYMGAFIATIGDRRVKTGESLYMWTYRHDVFKPYYDRFYSHGKTKKYFTIKSIQGLEPRGLAYWYMDDGKYHDYGAYLCVGKISPEEGFVLINYLREKFSIESTFQVQNIKKGHYNIYIKSESRNHFFNLIEPYIIKSMKYKITGDAPNKVFSTENLMKNYEELCTKTGRSIRYKGKYCVSK